MRINPFKFFGVLLIGAAFLCLAMITRYYQKVDPDLITYYLILLAVGALSLSVELEQEKR